jgi:hypothetical protein
MFVYKPCRQPLKTWKQNLLTFTFNSSLPMIDSCTLKDFRVKIHFFPISLKKKIKKPAAGTLSSIYIYYVAQWMILKVKIHTGKRETVHAHSYHIWCVHKIPLALAFLCMESLKSAPNESFSLCCSSGARKRFKFISDQYTQIHILAKANYFS